MDAYIPELEEDIPLPSNALEALPELTPQEELDMRARTLKFIADMQGEVISPTQEDKETAEELAHEMMTNPEIRPRFAKYPNETIAYLAGMVAHMNHSIVDDLSTLKNYVVNKLVMEVENAKDSRSRITALTKIGEVDGVDAFKKRSEVTVQVKPIEEVEKELLQVLEGIEYTVIKDETGAKSCN